MTIGHQQQETGLAPSPTWPRRAGQIPAPFEEGRVTYYLNGRAALWHAVKALGLPPGSTALVPSYQCGTELDAILKANLGVRFYRVDRSATIDHDDLRRKVDPAAKVLLVVHYFGFPQPNLPPLLELCRTNGMCLIEDCAHALYSSSGEGRLGSFGDLAVFSLSKSLPVPKGGVLLNNKPSLHVEQGAASPAVIPRHAPLRQSIVGRLRRAALRVASFLEPKPPSDDPGAKSLRLFDLATKDQPISQLALDAFRQTDPQAVYEARRGNYQFLLAELADDGRLRPLFSALPAGVCPLHLPMLVEGAESLRDHLKACGVRSTVWWRGFHPRFPSDEFPEATFLKTHVLALPIGQELDRRALSQIVDAVRSWRGGARGS